MFKEGQTIEEGTGPKNEPEQAEQIKQIRQKYLLSMAAGLGVQKETARERVDALFEMADRLPALDLLKDEEDLRRAGKEEIIETIKTIGSWFFPDDREKEEFLYPAGLRALTLLREKPGSDSFVNLRDMVLIWTFGKGEAGFDEVFNKDN